MLIVLIVIFLAFMGLFLALGLIQPVLAASFKGFWQYRKACFLIYATISLLLLPIAFTQQDGLVGFAFWNLMAFFFIGLTAGAYASIKS